MVLSIDDNLSFLNKKNKILIATSNFILNLTSWISGAVKNLFGVLGLLVLSPLLILLWLTAWILLLWTNYRIERDLPEIYSKLSSLPDPEKTDVHLQLERVNRIFSKLFALRNKKSVIILRPLETQILHTFNIFRDIENHLRLALYPNLNKVLSESESTQLKSKYSKIDLTDWEDESLDIYDQTYC